MLLGMGVVFIFLTIMVYAIKIQAVLIAKFFPVKEKTPVAKPQHHATPTHTTSTAQKVAAIAAAIHHHNQSEQK
jgi:oxaloacetate decarboxylase gamma subunit